MSEPRKTPDINQWNLKAAITAGWDTMPLESIAETELELLAAYAEGRATESEQALCEELVSTNPAALQLVEDLWEHSNCSSPVEATPLRSSPLRGSTSAARRLLQAACVAIGVMGVGWGLWSSQRLRQSDAQLAMQEQRWAETQLELGLVHKQQFLAEASSPVSSFWNGTVTSQMLASVRVRGTGESTPEALAQAEQARTAFQKLHDTSPHYAGLAALELASIEIASGHFDAAEERISDARTLLGDAAEVENCYAVLLLAKGDQKFIAEAERRLRSLVLTHPDYLAGSFNLALLLQQQFRDDESRTVWQEYLNREPRTEFRKAAKRHLDQLGG